MKPNYMMKLSLQICETKVNTQKTDGLKLDTFDMIIASFSLEDKERKSRFFEETFLLADISIYISLNIFFFTLRNIEIDFINCNIY